MCFRYSSVTLGIPRDIEGGWYYSPYLELPYTPLIATLYQYSHILYGSAGDITFFLNLATLFRIGLKYRLK